MEKVAHKELSYKITGLLFETHKKLGRHRNEKQYCDYFEKLLLDNKVKYLREYRFVDSENGQGMVRCICDFIIDGKVILEFKAKDSLNKEDYFQVKRYLTTLNKQLGILVNFRQPRIVPKRVLNMEFLNKLNNNL